jgi:hypothetical protein
MTRFFFFSLLFFSICSIEQGVAQNTGRIYWRQDSILEWTDFKGRPDTMVRYYAMSTTGMEVKPEVGVKNNKVVVKYVLKAFFNPSGSWSQKQHETSKILHHEQIHFDIVECIARIGTIELDKYAEADARKSKTEVEALLQKLMMKNGEMHKRYDDQTIHGSNESMQKKWEQYTIDLLKNPTTLDEAWKKLPADG